MQNGGDPPSVVSNPRGTQESWKQKVCTASSLTRFVVGDPAAADFDYRGPHSPLENSTRMSDGASLDYEAVRFVANWRVHFVCLLWLQMT